VTVKETDLAAALSRVPSGLINDGIVVPFLNGIDHMQILRNHFTRSRVVAGTIRVESMRSAVGEIHQVSPFTVVEVAPPQPTPPALAEFCRLLDRAGVDVQVRDDENSILWGKLSFLAPLALLTTAHSAPAGEIRTTYRGELVKVVGEVAAVARGEGTSIDEAGVLALVDAVPETMQSSMQRDLAAGRPIEIEAIGGAVVRHAEAHAIDVPDIERIVAELRLRSASA
jgi:2-dehydropantoate 2-reductase